jgi:hypothetical protein
MRQEERHAHATRDYEELKLFLSQVIIHLTQ